ncbi:HisA/HisF-related TIM barrel protein [Azospirillum sp. TSO22-1]|uniref:HisA/HisF-related TIM barrel protein n=1 Tax=Azospirillum sp. TSO22-1 TaxID=716789 RepID=UPI001FFFBD63|nr:HisA/HisF-related TIM barrel protein [Azospirillum sp. TSO22-1]
MELIPVLDLLGGTVVHARQGDRSRYQPLQSSLCAGSAPEDVVEGLLRLHPFRSLYVADLDAIRRTGDHRAVTARLAARFPQLILWVDAGVNGPREAVAVLEHGARVVVAGTESLASAADLVAIRAAVPTGALALSLDWLGDRFLGPPELEHGADAWPERVIVMTLARVGSAAGPDVERLSAVQARADGRSVYAAGGVRGAEDLEALARMGVAGVLLASALHDGRLEKSVIGRLDTGQ